MAVQTSTGVLGSYLDGKMSVKGEIELRKSLFAHVLRSSWRGREVFHSGDAVNRMEEDIKTVVDIVCVRFPDAIITSVQLVAASVFLLRRSPSLVWILILLMVFAVLGSKLFFKTIRSLTAKIRNTESRIQSFLQENIQQRMLVLTLLGVDRVVNRFDDLQGELSSDVAERLRFNAIARSFMNFGFTSGYAVAFIWGILNIRSGAITYGIMTALLQLAGQIQRPVAELGKNLPSFINSLTSVERLMDISQLELEEPSEELRFDKAPGIAVNDLSFSFPEDESLVIENLNFDFKPGTMTVITGVTGAGKSTLVKLILGLLKPVQGSVVMYSDSQNAKCGSGTRCNIMYVPQGGSLMSGTIRENLALACPGMTDEQAAEVLHLAAADFVFSLSHGLDTVCAEAGNGLSEGQAQRIAIARALLCPGTVLILDESTSALDPETEQILLDNLSSAYKGKKTIIFVSHREAVSHYADASLSL